MKIAITGHTAGIGQAFAKILQHRGHDIVDNLHTIKQLAHKISFNMLTTCCIFY